THERNEDPWHEHHLDPDGVTYQKVRGHVAVEDKQRDQEREGERTKIELSTKRQETPAANREHPRGVHHIVGVDRQEPEQPDVGPQWRLKIGEVPIDVHRRVDHVVRHARLANRVVERAKEGEEGTPILAPPGNPAKTKEPQEADESERTRANAGD